MGCVLFCSVMIWYVTLPEGFASGVARMGKALERSSCIVQRATKSIQANPPFRISKNYEYKYYYYGEEFFHSPAPNHSPECNVRP